MMLTTAIVLGCGPAVSDHDNRIFAVGASVKLSAADLSMAYASDARAADGRYRGRVLEVSGVVSAVRAAATPVPAMIALAGSEAGPKVEASLHEDAAAGILKTVAEGQRLTIKCFCEGLDQHVRLKSCVPPDTGR
jgi:hypothetical protein